MTVGELEQQADTLAMNRDFAGARRCLAEAVQLDPKRFAAWMKLAAMANAMGDAAAALRAANGALAVQPLDSTALLMRAMQLHNLGSTDEAGMAYGRALAQLPDAYAPQMEPVIAIARARYRAWQQRQHDDLAAKVSATTPMTDKLKRFIGSALHIEPFEREGPTHYCYPGLGDAGYYDEALFGWMAELEAAKRVASQANPAQRANAADVILNSNQDLNLLLKDADSLWLRIQREAFEKLSA